MSSSLKRITTTPEETFEAVWTGVDMKDLMQLVIAELLQEQVGDSDFTDVVHGLYTEGKAVTFNYEADWKVVWELL